MILRGGWGGSVLSGSSNYYLDLPLSLDSRCRELGSEFRKAGPVLFPSSSHFIMSFEEGQKDNLNFISFQATIRNLFFGCKVRRKMAQQRELTNCIRVWRGCFQNFCQMSLYAPFSLQNIVTARCFDQQTNILFQGTWAFLYLPCLLDQ